MPLQNRVLPSGEIVAIPARGMFTGNRGIIHGPDRVLTKRRWSHKAWICCTLDWQGRKRKLMSGRNWTELFFLDEAVALAAGHRPCAYCRRADYKQFKAAWEAAYAQPVLAPDMDQVLHPARTDAERHDQRRVSDLPDGAFFRKDGEAMLVAKERILRFTPERYVVTPLDRDTTDIVRLLTPSPMVGVLHAGYKPMLHPSATI